MERLSKENLRAIVVCANCKSDNIKVNDGNWQCTNCNSSYHQYKHKPVFLNKNNELFPPSAYIEKPNTKASRRSSFYKIKQLIPSRSINLSRDKYFKLLASRVEEKETTILVIGCGNQVSQIQKTFLSTKTFFVFCDIDINADVDIFCDSHELPFKDSTFDGVITTAVLEHVLYPEKVVSEIFRVLKPNAFVYSEIPFLQAVHEGAYDFTRYTLSGHRRLFEYFSEEASGMVAGPATSFLWSLDMLLKSMTSNKRLSSVLSILVRLSFGWIKYLDKYLEANSLALDAASCTYYLGKKSNSKRPAGSIIDAYSNSTFRHT